ncbi:hypothetical protein ACFQ9Z_16090 [Streptomyces sp. NPDC056580]|uniref:hypothetical protein n=1 Tax=Streptomyces sp. NPDC056580 TaxID=3345872 RepID=UPI0036B5BB6C
MPADWVRELSIAGTPHQARAAINARHAGGATSVVLAPAGTNALTSPDSLARALPHRPDTHHRTSGTLAMSPRRPIVLFDLFGVIACHRRPGAMDEMVARSGASTDAFTSAHWTLRQPYDA